MAAQDWRDLSFVHWAVPPDRVAAYFPPGVQPDLHEGLTYVGLVPFRMVDFGFGRRFPLPWLGTFLETNVRLYSVDQTGRRGVVFLSLDCQRLLFVVGARAALDVPYRWARMSHHVSTVGRTTRHAYTTRLLRPGPPVRGRVVVNVGEPKAEPTELDHFLTARWGVHTRHVGRDLYTPNQHDVWPLHDASLDDLDDQVLASVGLGELADRAPDHVAFSPGVRTEFGLPVSSRSPRRPA